MKYLKILLIISSLLLLASCGEKTNDNNIENDGGEEITQNNNQNLSIDDFEITEDNVDVTEWVTGLDTPWELVFLDANRALVSERNGKILLLKDGIKSDYFTLPVHEEGEGGLMGLEKDPDYTSNKYIYAMYTYKKDSDEIKNTVVRLKDLGNTAEVDIVLIDEIPGNLYHNGGRIKFGPDKKLYVTTGDAQEPNLAQDLTSLAGKILRMNNDGSIPSDNPFPNSYVYTYGHRNLQGLAFEPNTGDLFSSGHGPTGEINGWQKNDRIDYVVAGKNYGWPEVLGFSDGNKYQNPLVLWEINGKPPAGMTFWNNILLIPTLKSELLVALYLDKVNDNRQIAGITELFNGKYGRLRDAVVGPDGNLYLMTSNQDGRGAPNDGDDKILKITVK